jgi:hypothetical protein
LFPAAETANRAKALSFPLVDFIAHVDCLFVVVCRRFLGVVARRWRLVHEVERLGSARQAAQEEEEATVRVVEKWCRRAEATGTVDDTPRVGIPRAPLESRKATRLLKEGVKRGNHCPNLPKCCNTSKE